MVDIRINYETLFDLLRREKNREELQTLDKDFYEQVLAYLKEKKDSLSRKDDELFASAEREKLKIQFQNIRRIIKELYERREKKILTMAMSKARTGSDVIDTSALLPSEREFFNEQVLLFTKYKETMLDRILNLKEEDSAKLEGVQEVKEVQEAKARAEVRKEVVEERSDDENLPDPGAQATFATIPEKKRVIILDSMPKFMGRNNEILGPFNEGEEVELDTFIADLLVKKGKAEMA
ncbi:hypothetical protein JW756_04695 [Candidatus Woesearchaeota archaeon]|nr:hypothetical protein [Candidatus Woesearchaeota archaeon]